MPREWTAGVRDVIRKILESLPRSDGLVLRASLRLRNTEALGCDRM